MAQKVEVTLISDLSGDVADETVTFGLDGTEYEADLSAKEANALRKAMSKYVEVSRKVTGRKAVAKKGPARSGPDAKEVREWARSQGYTVTDRGRIPGEIMEKYQAVH